MEHFIYHFPISGVKTYIFLPPLIMFLISSFVSTGGVSGAFILLPIQISIFGYTSPGVTATNFIYNIISIPSGIYRYIKNKQISWTLIFNIMLGTIPGILIGYHVRTNLLLDPYKFKSFVGCVLGALGIKVFHSAISKKEEAHDQRGRIIHIRGESLGLIRSEIYTSNGTYEYSSIFLIITSFFVSIIGTAYGIGGGAILAPFCMSILNLPSYLVSGAAFFTTWMNSIIAASIYAFFSYKTGINAMPDWMLGSLFGIGGLFGIYLGASMQRYIPERAIKTILGCVLLFISFKYLKGLLQ